MNLMMSRDTDPVRGEDEDAPGKFQAQGFWGNWRQSGLHRSEARVVDATGRPRL